MESLYKREKERKRRIKTEKREKRK